MNGASRPKIFLCTLTSNCDQFAHGVLFVRVYDCVHEQQSVPYGVLELYCTVLYCTSLYSTVLHCTVLYSAVLSILAVQYCTILSHTVLYSVSNTLYSTVLHSATHNSTVQCITLVIQSRDRLTQSINTGFRSVF